MTPDPAPAPQVVPQSEDEYFAVIAEDIVRNHNTFCIGHVEETAAWCSCAPMGEPLCESCAKLKQAIIVALKTVSGDDPAPVPAQLLDRVERLVRDGHYSILRSALAQRGEAGSRIFLEELAQLVREALPPLVPPDGAAQLCECGHPADHHGYQCQHLSCPCKRFMPPDGAAQLEEGKNDHMPTTTDDLGLTVDMLAVDRLREWARLLLVHGADISHWGSVPHVASKLQILATNFEKAIRDIGTLRQLAKAHPDGAAAALKAKWRAEADRLIEIARSAEVDRLYATAASNSASAATLYDCADELEAALAALPEARRQEDDALARGDGTGNSTLLQSAASKDDSQ